MSDRAMVVGNKIIYAKLKIQENKWMRNRLLSVQSTVDNKIPHSFKPGGPFTRKDGTRRVNLKKMQLKEDRRRLIAQDNAIMLKSISNIMRHNKKRSIIILKLLLMELMMMMIRLAMNMIPQAL